MTGLIPHDDVLPPTTDPTRLLLWVWSLEIVCGRPGCLRTAITRSFDPKYRSPWKA